MAYTLTVACTDEGCTRLGLHAEEDWAEHMSADPQPERGLLCCEHQHPESAPCDQPFCCFAEGDKCLRVPEWVIYLPAGYPPELTTEACADHLGHLLGYPEGYPPAEHYTVFPMKIDLSQWGA